MKTKTSLDNVNREERKRFPLTDEKITEIGNKEGINWNNTREVCARFNTARDRVYRIQAKVE